MAAQGAALEAEGVTLEFAVELQPVVLGTPFVVGAIDPAPGFLLRAPFDEILGLPQIDIGPDAARIVRQLLVGARPPS